MILWCSDYADVLLMKAEALLRTNDAAGALAIVNSIRAKRGVADLGALDARLCLMKEAEKCIGKAYRRQDLIRFGKFLQAMAGKGCGWRYSKSFIPNSKQSIGS